MQEKSLRRYTTLPYLIDVLIRRRLTLLDPSSWDDKNDSHFITLYKEKRELKSVLALCFTRAGETYHHWRVFAPGSAGVCIELDRLSVEIAGKKLGARLKTVDYLTLQKIRDKRLRTSQLPSLKRHAFHPEDEVRWLWESKTKVKESLEVPIRLAAIKRITLSPWLHPTLTEVVKSLLQNIDGCHDVKIYRSTLIGNAEWMSIGRAAV